MTRVAVVGLGLIGGSAALAFDAVGYDRDAAVRERARGRGITVADTLADAVDGARFVVTAVSTAQTPALLREVSVAAPGALLTDTASLKQPIVAAAHTLRAGTRFVGGHPMAGSNREGVEAADRDLFRGRPWAVVSTARGDPAAVEEVSGRVRVAGARPLLLQADRHDRLMTWLSHLPHAVAVALTRAAGAETVEDLPPLAGPGFRDTTRIAGRRVALALELSLADPGALADAIETVRGELARLSAALRAGDETEIARTFAEAARVRRALDPSP